MPTERDGLRFVPTTLSRAEAVCAVTKRLRDAGIEQPRREARLLVAHALGITRDMLLRDPAVPADVAAVLPLAARRAGGEPLAFITGRREFWSLDLEVSPATLIPRPDSETLIEAALAACPDRGALGRVLDLGTGTGCLLLAVLSEFPGAFGVGVDRVQGAAALAARNAVRLGFADRAAFLCGDWSAALASRFNLVLSNPPYVTAAEMAGLQREVRLHEPASALEAGADGLDAYRRIIAALPDLVAPDGIAILELGAGQAEDVAAIAHQAGFCMDVRRDLAGIARAGLLRRHACAKKQFGSAEEGG